MLEAVLWIFNTGAQWHMLPQSYPNYKTVHRRFQTWCSNEVLRRVLTDVANELRDKGVLDEEESFIDATFAMAKGGGAEIGPTKRGKGMKIMAIVDTTGMRLCSGATTWLGSVVMIEKLSTHSPPAGSFQRSTGRRSHRARGWRARWRMAACVLRPAFATHKMRPRAPGSGGA